LVFRGLEGDFRDWAQVRQWADSIAAELTLAGSPQQRRCDMAMIEGEILIDRPVDVVFDYVADQSNEPQYNPQMVRAEKITPGAGR
jgi:hypothetical protein